jgi:sugar O-acyltransferase (sialic acid O-acetyltransferase NeuD family)
MRTQDCDTFANMNNFTNTNWTVLGLGNFFFEVLEIINILGGKVAEVIINQEPNQSVVDKLPSELKITKLNQLRPSSNHYVFGFTSPNKKEFTEALSQYELSFPNLIHPSVVMASSAKLGIGNVIQPGVVIASNARIGNYNFLNRSSSMGHDLNLGNYNHVGPNSAICGMVSIGDYNFLGAGSVVIDKISIQSDIILGAGGVLTRDALQPGTYLGIPAKIKET